MPRTPRAGVDPAADLDRVRKLAEVLDTKFQIAGIKFGVDALVGLIPLVGDAATTLVSLYPLYVAQQHRVGLMTRARMLGNVAIDWAVGLVPLVGDLFDVGFKANTRNLRILEQALSARLQRDPNAPPRM